MHARTHTCTCARGFDRLRFRKGKHLCNILNVRMQVREIRMKTHADARGFDKLRLKICKTLSLRILNAWQYWSYCDRHTFSKVLYVVDIFDNYL
jgi:hypothetical protein